MKQPTRQLLLLEPVLRSPVHSDPGLEGGGKPENLLCIRHETTVRAKAITHFLKACSQPSHIAELHRVPSV